MLGSIELGPAPAVVRYGDEEDMVSMRRGEEECATVDVAGVMARSYLSGSAGSLNGVFSRSSVL